MKTLKQLIDEYCPDGVEYVRLGDVVDYEQPSKYLVKSTDYDDSYETPVLTAGKTFLLGYTDETAGVYHASPTSPAIIFDDFTTASKWVDFPFKVKSSAMKILTARDASVSLRFVYLAMHGVEVDTTDHKRQWISAYSNELIPLPPLEVQDKLVQYLDTFSALCDNLDTEIAQRERQLAEYRSRLLSETNLEASCGSEGAQRVRLGDVAPYANLRVSAETLDKSTFVGVDNLLKNMAGKIDSTFGASTKMVTGFVAGDVLVGNIRPYLKKIWLADSNGGCSGDVLAFHPTGIAPKFLFHNLCSGRFWSYNVQHSKGAKMPRGDKKLVLDFPILLPPRAVQDELVQKLDAMQAVIDNLRLERRQRQKQFDYYREKLLTFTAKKNTEV